MNDKQRELLNKIKALAEKGVGGEKINAQKKLKELLEKFNLSEDDLEKEKEQLFTFHIRKGLYLDKLFWQLVAHFRNVDTLRGYKISKYEWELVLYPNEAIELEAKYNFYVKAFKEDLETFYSAFLHTNDLLVPAGFHDKQPTKKELEEYEKAQNMSQGMEKHTFNKLIEVKDND